MTRPALALLVATTLVPSQPAPAQGCAQCRDNAAGTPPVTQRAYRNAISLLTLTAGGLFVTTVSLLRRNR